MRVKRGRLIGAMLMGAAGVLAGSSFVSCCAAQPASDVQPHAPAADPGTDDPATDDLTKDVLDMDLEQLAQADVVVTAFDQEVVSVTGTESTIGRSAAAVFVITEEMIRRSGATSLPEALRLAPGLNVARIDAGRWAISSRGFNGRFANMLLVLVDGRSIYTLAFAGVFWETLDYPLQDIDRIEVIRGPGATLWGENAVNGVINIITKHTKDTQGLLIAAGGGDYDESINVARYGGRLADDVHYRVYAKHFERDSFNDVLLPAEDDWRMKRVGFRIDGALDKCDRDKFMLQGDIYSGTAGESGFWAVPPPTLVEPYTHNDQLDGGHILGRWTHRYSEDETAWLQVFYDRTQRYANITDSAHDTFDVSFQHDVRVNPVHKITWGLEYRNMQASLPANNPFVLHFQQPELTVERVGGFLMDEIFLIDEKLKLYLGSRVSYNEFTEIEVQPTARVVWAISDRRIGWGAVSRAVRTPSGFERLLRFTQFVPMPAPGYVEFVGNSGVEAENVVAYEIGYRAQPAEWFSWDVAAFYNRYTDLVGTNVTGFVPAAVPTTILSFANNSTAETAGVEWSATLDMTDDWRLTSWYSLLDNSDARFSPRNQVFLMSSWDLSRCVELDLMGRYVDSLSTMGVSSYISLDARLGWRPNRNLELSVVGQNLLDRDRLEFVDNGTGSVSTAVPRGFYGQAVWRF